ncbi:hypothetical protein SEPCBS57363_003687 [Sporothrix epigloea]|uniref:Uncharacterized protein n=1 Tax=Sporothrix epigloea TaxID=1892477 RepID=A0ABP0DQM0_9PEZI
MASNDGIETPVEGEQTTANCTDDLNALISDIEKMNITDENAWYALREALDGWREEDLKKSRVTMSLRTTMMKHGVFVGTPRPGTTLATAIFEAVEGDYQPKWTKEMAAAMVRYGPIRTIDPDLQSFLGRKNVDPRYWREPDATESVHPASITASTPVVPATAPEIENREHLVDPLLPQTPLAIIPATSVWTPVEPSSNRLSDSETIVVVEQEIFEEIKDCIYRYVGGFWDKYFTTENWTDEQHAMLKKTMTAYSAKG